MKPSWAQPSLSRDFALLSVAIISLLLLLSAWVTWVTYTTHSRQIIAELEQEAARIDRTLERDIENAGYLLNAIGRQLTRLDTNDLRTVGQLLKAFDSRKPVYEVWSWVDHSQRVVVSSNKGVMDQPVNVADRDYIHKTMDMPWQAQIGRPIQGRVSGKWVIPIGMGITDDTGRYLGTLVASIDIGALTEQIGYLIEREGISFAVMSRTFLPLTVVSANPRFVEENFSQQRLSSLNVAEHPKGVLSRAPLFARAGIYSYYQVSNHYPYVILVGYDNAFSTSQIRSQLWPRLVQIVALACFLLLFLWIVRARIIKPVVELTQVAARVARGEGFRPMQQMGPEEIDSLARQIERTGEYIAERRHVEEELREKLAEAQAARRRLEAALPPGGNA